jgi:hypothetical protein
VAKPRSRPTHPVEVKARLAELREGRSEAERLSHQSDVRVTRNANGTLAGAKRLDVFDLLLSRDALSQRAHDAVRRLEELAATASGALKAEASYDRVDTTTIGQNITDAMIDASMDVAKVLEKTGVRSSALLVALLEPSAALLSRWRDTVERLTGERNDRAQAACVRYASEDLAEAFNKLDYQRRAA